MNTRFLNPDEIAQVESIMATYGIDRFDSCVRLWGRGKNIQLSGDVGKHELACLLAIARYLNDNTAIEPREVAARAHAPSREQRFAEACV